MAGKDRSAPLDPKLADRLLELLGSDDSYRELFQKDPAAALAKIGYQAPTTETGGMRSFVECCTVQQLASKEAIAKARGEIRSMLTSGLPYTTPDLDASNSASRRSDT